MFLKKSRFHSRRQLFRKSCYSWERTIDGIDINDIGNVEDSHRFAFINEECENLIVVDDGEELAKNINQKKRSDILH